MNRLVTHNMAKDIVQCECCFTWNSGATGQAVTAARWGQGEAMPDSQCSGKHSYWRFFVDSVDHVERVLGGTLAGFLLLRVGQAIAISSGGGNFWTRFKTDLADWRSWIAHFCFWLLILFFLFVRGAAQRYWALRARLQEREQELDDLRDTRDALRVQADPLLDAYTDRVPLEAEANLVQFFAECLKSYRTPPAGGEPRTIVNVEMLAIGGRTLLSRQAQNFARRLRDVFEDAGWPVASDVYTFPDAAEQGITIRYSDHGAAHSQAIHLQFMLGAEHLDRRGIPVRVVERPESSPQPVRVYIGPFEIDSTERFTRNWGRS